MIVLLEERSYIVELDQPVRENVEEEPQQNYEEEISSLSSGPYRFLLNCNSAAVWMCAVYNLCVIIFLIGVYVYKHMK